MSPITEQQQYQLLTDPFLGKFAPMVLWQPMQRLAGGAANVKAAATSCLESAHTFRWAVAWLTDDVLVFGAATKTHHGGFWSALSEDQTCEDVTVWARALDQIRGIVADAPSVERVNGAGSKWLWRETYQVRFADNVTLRVPLFDNLPGGPAASEPALNLLDELIARLGHDVYGKA